MLGVADSLKSLESHAIAGAELSAIQLRVRAFGIQELGVSTGFDYAPVLQNYDAISPQNGREAVRDD